MEDKLNILILTLVSGEEVIANVKDHVEEIDGVKQKICYNIVYPFTMVKDGPPRDNNIRVNFLPWKYFSSDTSFLLGFDKVINMCTPLPNVVDTYKAAVDEFIKKMAEAHK